MMANEKTAAVIGAGVIGAGWAARYLAHGYRVKAWDPGSDAEQTLRQTIDIAWPSLQRVGLKDGASRENLEFAAALEEACGDAAIVHESTPEVIELKQAVLQEISRAAPGDAIIGSSTSGFMPSDLQQGLQEPGRLIVSHPFNPVYILPLVEVVAGAQTDTEVVEKAQRLFRKIGMYPLHVRKEVEGHLADRLLESLWRENLHLVNDGFATTGELDDAITYGPGLRWAVMGTNLTYHLAGGEDGMKHMLEQFGPALKLPWSHLQAPELNDELISRMVESTHKQAAGRSIAVPEQQRDNCLLSIMEALSEYEMGAGKILSRDRGSP